MDVTTNQKPHLDGGRAHPAEHSSRGSGKISVDRIGNVTSVQEQDRVLGFDCLRGICAIAVAYYHTLMWGGAAHLYNFGTYGVYIFFVLSGASIYLSYASKFERGYSLNRFLFLRLIRLAPLYWLVVLITMILGMHNGDYSLPNIGLSIVNIGFLFGFGNPGMTSTVTGGWSLGIEFIFYLCFPVFLGLSKGRLAALFLLGTFVAQHIFINTVLGGQHTLADQWGSYTQFLGFIFYFFSGCVIGRLVSSRRVIPHYWAIPVCVGILLAIYITTGAKIEETLIGRNGMLLSLAAAIVVYASAGLQFNGLFSYLARMLGNMSYGVYLLHPFVNSYLKVFFPKLNAISPYIYATAVIGLAIAFALVLERFFERPIRLHFKMKLKRSDLAGVGAG